MLHSISKTFRKVFIMIQRYWTVEKQETSWNFENTKNINKPSAESTHFNKSFRSASNSSSPFFSWWSVVENVKNFTHYINPAASIGLLRVYKAFFRLVHLLTTAFSILQFVQLPWKRGLHFNAFSPHPKYLTAQFQRLSKHPSTEKHFSQYALPMLRNKKNLI